MEKNLDSKGRWRNKIVAFRVSPEEAEQIDACVRLSGLSKQDYPDLYLPEETEYPIGKYGMLRKTYLKEHRKGLYLELVLAGKLNEHLHLIDEECNQMMDRLVEQMKEKQGVTEELKMQDQMAWVGRMNNILIATEEVIILSMVYV